VAKPGCGIIRTWRAVCASSLQKGARFNLTRFRHFQRLINRHKRDLVNCGRSTSRLSQSPAGRYLRGKAFFLGDGRLLSLKEINPSTSLILDDVLRLGATDAAANMAK
jgi:hypothetical protein